MYPINLKTILISSNQVNFSGGEPFIIDKGNYLGEMVRFCKEDLDMDSVTVVTNGSKVMSKNVCAIPITSLIVTILSPCIPITFIFTKVTETWMQEFGYWLDIMAVSCDSFDEEINKKIGRYILTIKKFHTTVIFVLIFHH